MLEQRLRVSCGFVHNKIQLFYEASLDRVNGKICLRVFNHHGVLKNRRMIEIDKGIEEIYCAEEYVIGLDQQHEKVWIVDVSRTTDCIVRGWIGQENGLTRQMRANRLRFSQFIYDRFSNLIYGIYGNHYIFYIRINSFDSVSYSGLHKNIAEVNRNISINKIIHSQESIDKVEVRIQKGQMKQLRRGQRKQRGEKMVELMEEGEWEKDGNGSRYQEEGVSLICLLIKEKKLLRIYQMDWENDTPLTVTNQQRVYDFCFRNGWDLVFRYEKLTKHRHQRETSRYHLKTKHFGEFQQTVSLSDSHVIFCSARDIFVIDPEMQSITGVHNRQWISIIECPSIPKCINPNNTLLVVERQDELFLRFIFQVYDSNASRFKNTQILTPLYVIAGNLQLQLELKKNIGMIFTKNAFIHQMYRQKVQKCVCSILRQESNQMSNDQSMERRQELEIYINNKFQSSSQLGRLFLEKFVMSDQKLLDRLLYGLIHSGVKSLFGPKQQALSVKKSLKQKQSVNPLETKRSTPDEGNQQNKYSQINHHRCVFDRWNEYFQEILSSQYQILRSLFVENGDSNNDRSQSEYSSSVDSILTKIYQQLKKIKLKLTLISNTYTRFLTLIETAQGQSQNIQFSLKQNIKTYQQRIKSNINKAHSLFLIYDIFRLGRLNHERGSQDQCLERITNAVIKVFETFQKARQSNIKEYKKYQPNPWKPLEIRSHNNYSIQPELLMLHQHFTHARLLAIPSQKMTFELFLEYLLLNLEEFEQIGYFYYLIKNEITGCTQEEQGSQSGIDQNQGKITYPYLSRNMVSFFNIVRTLPHQIGLKWDQNRMEQNRIKIEKMGTLALIINKPSFINYTIQMCSVYHLPTILLKLINSLPIQPFITPKQMINQNQLSALFIYRERLIIKSLLYSGFGPQDYRFECSLREIIFLLVKRILQIGDVISAFEKKRQLNPLESKHSGQEIKFSLLKQLITYILSKSYQHGIRQVEQLKNQLLTLDQDKRYIDQITNNIIWKNDEDLKMTTQNGAISENIIKS